MERIDTIEETYDFYAQMGGVRHALPHGIEYRFPTTPPTGGRNAREPGGAADASPLGQGGGEEVSKDVIRLLGDLSSFVYPRSISPRPPTTSRARGFPASTWESRSTPTGPSKRIPPATTRAS